MLCLLLVGILASDGYGQKEIKLQADYAYQKMGYSSSADLYEQVGASRLNTAAKARLGDSYRLNGDTEAAEYWYCLLYTSPSPRDKRQSRMPSSA